MLTKDALLRKRNAKVKLHLEQYAPVWIVGETIIAEDEAVQFDTVFRHNLYGWVKRRYRYDGFNDILYYKGQTVIAEEEVIEIEQKDPFILVAVTDTPNAYGG
ncbi:MAG: hypothetical protein SF029_03675 [bacterium]|nr:hypothetical protein [bacterium]